MGGGEMTLVTKRATAAVSATDDEDDPYGSFDIILSTSDRDRDNEVVSSKSWKLPLPAVIPINVDHSPSVSDVIGSGRPWIDADGNLRVVGKFASSDAAQHVRGLVAEGHVQSVSVEFLRRKGADGQPVNELVGGAFVSVPANPEARVLQAKAFGTELDRVIKAASNGDAAMLRAIHDAVVHLGAVCGGMDAGESDDGESEDGVTGASDGANKAAALALRMKALRRA